VMQSPCAGAALDPSLWIIPNKELSLPFGALRLTVTCVCILLQYLVQSCSRGGGGGTREDMCYERLRAEACVD
jgi:hypothetical protein